MNDVTPAVAEEQITYKYLIASALAEEMEAFYQTDQAFSGRVPVKGEVEVTALKFPSSEQKILTFACARMPLNLTLNHLPIVWFWPVVPELSDPTTEVRTSALISPKRTHPEFSHISDIGLFRYLKSVIHLDSEIPYRTL